MFYKAFISYSHAADGELAPALQSGLQRFTKPWYRLRAMRVFRDQTGLHLTSELWPMIQKALEQSEYFLLLASPDAAKSEWVAKEVDYWLQIRSPSTLLIIWTGGELKWNGVLSDFAWDLTTAIPRRLEKAFKTQPLYLDLCWAHSSTHLSLREPRFLDGVATIASALYQRPKEDLSSEEVRQFRATRLLVRLALGTLAGLTLAASIATVLAIKQRDKANQQQQLAIERLVQMSTANGLRLQEQGDTCRSLLWFMNALKLESGHPSGEEKQRVRLANTLRDCPRLDRVWIAKDSIESLVLDKEERWIAAASAKDTADPQDTEKWTEPRRMQPSGMQIWDMKTGLETVLPSAAKTNAPVAVAVTLQGSRMCLIAAGTAVEMWNIESGAKVMELPHEAEVLSADFDRDARHIVTISSDNAAHIWDAETGHHIEVFAHPTNVLSAELSADGKKLTTVCREKVFVWDIQTKTNFTIQLGGLGSQCDWRGKRLFTVTAPEGDAKVWDGETGQQVSSLGDYANVVEVAISPDGKRVAVRFVFSPEVMIWDLETDKELRTITHSEGVISMEFSPDGKWLATGGYLGAARVWDVETGRAVTPPLWHQDGIGSLRFSNDGQTLWTSSGKILRKWRLGGMSPMALESPDTAESVESVCFSKDGQRVLISCEREAQLWNLKERTSVTLKYKPGACLARRSKKGDWLVPLDDPDGGDIKQINVSAQLYHACFSPDGKWIVTASDDWRARLWNAQTGEMVRSFVHPLERVKYASFSPDSRMLLTAVNGGIRLWELEKTNKPIWSAEGRYMEWAEFTQDGKRIAAVGSEGLQVWDASTRQELTAFRRENAQAVALSADGRRIATSEDEKVCVFDMVTGHSLGQPIKMRFSHSKIPIALTPDGARMVIADDDARVWTTTPLRVLSSPLKHSSSVLEVAFSTDGKRVATAGADKTARLWDGVTGVPLSPPLKHPEDLRGMAFSLGGSRLAIGSGKKCFVWDLSADSDSNEQLDLLTELLSCSIVDGTSTIVPLDEPSFAAAWQKYQKHHNP